MSTIYQLTEELSALQSMLEDADGDTTEAITNTILGLSGEIGDVVEDAIKLIKNIDGDVSSIDAEITRLTIRKQQFAGRVSGVRDAIRQVMEKAGYDKLKTALFSITLAKGRESVVVVDESLIPDDYVVVKTIVQPDKKAIGEAFKAGQAIPGCEYVRGEKSLRIK